MEKEKLRSEISEEFKWSIDKIFSDINSVENAIKETENICDEIVKYKGKIMSTGQNLYNLYELLNNYSRKILNLYVYAHMLCDSDTKNTENQALKMKIDALYEKLSEKISFISPEMLDKKYEDVLKLIEEEPKLELYRFDLEKTFRYREHTLSKELEELITKANNTFGGCAEVFYNLDNSDINLGFIEDENKNKV